MSSNSTLEKNTMNPFEFAKQQLTKAFDLMSLSEDVMNQLKTPMQVKEVSIPITMDSGENKVFQGYRVRHNDLRGPTKGGLRFHADVSIEDVSALQHG